MIRARIDSGRTTPSVPQHFLIFSIFRFFCAFGAFGKLTAICCTIARAWLRVGIKVLYGECQFFENIDVLESSVPHVTRTHKTHLLHVIHMLLICIDTPARTRYACSTRQPTFPSLPPFCTMQVGRMHSWQVFRARTLCETVHRQYSDRWL